MIFRTRRYICDPLPKHSLQKYKIKEDPEAFAEVGEGSLVYAIHCYAQVYKSIAERPRPAILIGTDVGNFARFDAYAPFLETRDAANSLQVRRYHCEGTGKDG